MIPEVFPVFTYHDILVHEDVYEQKDQKTTVGWLKYLFLWQEDGSIASNQDYKDYNDTVDIFKKINKIPKSTNLHDWEDKTSKRKQAECLNKLRKELKYIEVIDR
jgi:hypothetical protein